MSLSSNRYLDTLLLHQRFCLRLGFYGCNRLAAFDPHGGLNSLDDFPVEIGSSFHFFPLMSPRQLGGPLTRTGMASFSIRE